MMTQEEVLAIFREADAVLDGHFILSSGLRSPVFLQKAKVFQYPDKTEQLCKALAEKIKASGILSVDAIIGPAVGGIIPAYETARQMQLPAMYVEREEGKFTLRRGFDLRQNARVIIIEDIVTTGLSVREAIDALAAINVETVAVGCLIDRSAGEADVGKPLISLTQYKVPAYQPDELPPELAAIPAIKPGSRGLK